MAFRHVERHLTLGQYVTGIFRHGVTSQMPTNSIFTQMEISNLAKKTLLNYVLWAIHQLWFCLWLGAARWPKIISRKYTMSEVSSMVIIPSWKVVRVPKAMESLSLKLSYGVRFVQYTNFDRVFWRAHETLVTHLHDPWLRLASPGHN